MRAVLPNGGVVNPGEMISTARNAEVMLQLDRVARLSAIRNASRTGIQEAIFINFNPSTRCDPEVCLQDMVEEAANCGIDAARIVFEVTESECITDSEHLRKILSFYRTHGFRIALDDLGSGYSSLNLLTELRPDFVKLDMALIRGIDQDRYKQHVKRSLLEMSQKLGVGTVVEGVETDGEWQWATEHGAHLIQGFYFAKPAFVPPLGPDLETWSREMPAVRRTA
jgi:EAL domain-containing protein (putative c-di-GMP-specific phosphodiesterase class I)